MIKAIRLLTLLCISVFMVPIMAYAWGDNSGLAEGRPEYTEAQINNGDLGDTITFNSISDGVIGHEFNFVGAIKDTDVDNENKIWNDDITVEDGKSYLVRLYIHNNNPNGYDAVAKNVRVAFNIPREISREIQVDGFLSSSNATPTEYWDDVVFKSDVPFYLEYIHNSAFIENNGLGNMTNNNNQIGGYKLSDNIVNSTSEGILIGYNKLDGNIPGCYEYGSYIGITVKAIFSDQYRISSYVRKANSEDEWNKDINMEAQIGDELEYQILYENISDREQRNVMIRNHMPNNLKYISGSTRLWNTNYSEGVTNSDDAISTTGINIGNYAPGANAYIRFKVKIVDENLAEGANRIVNLAEGGIADTIQSDLTTVVIKKDSPLISKPIMLCIVFVAIMLIVLIILRLYKK